MVMLNEDLAIRAMSSDDLIALDRFLPSADEAKYRKRLLEQNAGLITFLVAWLDARPVGHAFVRWDAGEPLRSKASGAPIIGDFGVEETLRSQGIGSKLLVAAEDAVRAGGHTTVGLAVDAKNTRARALYERSGYVDLGLKPQPSKWSFIDREGQLQTVEEDLIYLVKDLGSSAE